MIFMITALIHGIILFFITPAVRGLEELFSAALERFLEPIHDLRVYCKN
jgi:hypothetical protein